MSRLDGIVFAGVDPATGLVWHSDGGHLHCSGLGADQFVTSPVVGSACELRVCGCHVNASLLAAALRAREGRDIVVATTGCGRACDVRASLDALWIASVDPGVRANWTAAKPTDYVNYAMLAAWEGDRVTDMVRRHMPYHPAWPALSFISDRDVDAACRLLRVIGDPRWFVDARRPNRMSRLLRYLGITPGVMAGVAAGRASAGDPVAVRARAVVDYCLPVRPAADYAAPGEFLRRIALTAPTKALGYVKAGRRFVQFVVWVWLQGLRADRFVFDADSFFKTPREIRAYGDHVTSLTGSASAV